jgi:RNA polymerase sigma factor (sigma-70 family)
MLRRCPELRRWEQTDDVVQGAALRLHQTLQKIRPATVREFCGLVALHVRRELVDLLRKAQGPQGIGANHATWDSQRQGRLDARADTAGPATLCWWAEFHRQAAALPTPEREVFELIYYQGLTHSEASALLGTSERTCKRHYRNAKLQLHAALAERVTDEPGT